MMYPMITRNCSGETERRMNLNGLRLHLGMVPLNPVIAGIATLSTRGWMSKSGMLEITAYKKVTKSVNNIHFQ